tara:strand:+ start:732 stop:950 length:219 start_codon:yes stop_codon:yes gene_type:complete
MFDKNEINVLASALNNLGIKGSDAAYIYSIQLKLNEELLRIEKAEKKKEGDLKLGPPELRDNKVEQKTIKKP